MANGIKHIHVTTDPLVVGQRTFQSVNNHVLSESDLEKASNELNETEAKKNKYIRELSEKLSKDGIKYRLDGDYLLRHLRVRKYDCDRAYRIIQDIYAKRRKNPNLFSLPPHLDVLINTGFLTVLPYKGTDGSPTIIIRFKYWNPKMPFANLAPAVFAICDIVNSNPHCQIHGINSIWDPDGASIRLIPDVMRYGLFMLPIIQESYPWRINKVILVNCSTLHKQIYNRLKVLIKKKVVEKIKIFGCDHSELHQLIDPSVLPKYYGGHLDEKECSITQHVLDNLPYLKYERSFGSHVDD